MQCNIDAKGKAVRLVVGSIMAIVGAVLLGLVALGVTGGPYAAGIGIALVLFGGFGIFEARAGWCVVRALGFRTPL